jgi:hypothetical protein
VLSFLLALLRIGDNLIVQMLSPASLGAPLACAASTLLGFV